MFKDNKLKIKQDDFKKIVEIIDLSLTKKHTTNWYPFSQIKEKVFYTENDCFLFDLFFRVYSENILKEQVDNGITIKGFFVDGYELVYLSHRDDTHSINLRKVSSPTSSYIAVLNDPRTHGIAHSNNTQSSDKEKTKKVVHIQDDLNDYSLKVLQKKFKQNKEIKLEEKESDALLFILKKVKEEIERGYSSALFSYINSTYNITKKNVSINNVFRGLSEGNIINIKIKMIELGYKFDFMKENSLFIAYGWKETEDESIILI